MVNLEKYVLKKDLRDASGMILPKGMAVYEFNRLKNPMTHRELSLLYLDNGTGYIKLMNKSAYDTLELRNSAKRSKLQEGEILDKVTEEKHKLKKVM
jgi:hypothetical protein